MSYRIIFSICLLVLIGYIVPRSVDLKELTGLLWQFPKEQLLILCVISSVIATLKSWRFLMILRNSDIKISFWECFRATIAGQALSPLPGGEVARGIFITKETNTTLIKATGPIILQAYIELFSSGVLGLIGALYFAKLRIPISIILVILLGLGSLLTFSSLLQQVIHWSNWVKPLNKLLRLLKHPQLSIKEVIFDEDLILIKVLMVSFLANFFGGILVFLTAQFFSVHLNILQAIFIYSCALLIQGFAISPGGLGFTEGGMVGLLLAFGASITQSLIVTLIFRTVTFVFYVLSGMIFLLSFYPKVAFNPRKELV